MSTATSILVTLLLVGGGIGTYHVVTSGAGPSAPPEAALAIPDGDLRVLEARLDALEAQGPVLQGSTTPQDVYDRLRRLEERLAALEKGAPTRTTVVGDTPPLSPDSPSAAPQDEVVALPDGSPSPLTKAQEQRVRDLVDSTMQSRFRGRASGRIDRTLNELGIELTPDQRTKLDAALSEHFQTIRETVRQARESGQSREEIGAQIQELNRSLTDTLSTFIAGPDAEALTTSLTARPPRGGPPPGFFGGAGAGNRR